ncbi:MAG: FAD-dependent oxidoreductase [Methanomicrobiaceae archaeon]|nr:FAD-dependent oxidoreductase [Methanomicrobiaceae archaeon]
MRDRTNPAYTLPGKAVSYWLETIPETRHPPLSEDIRVDVAILGGGMVGITSALLLKEAGLSVAVIEADRIFRGVSGHTTAKVTSQHHLIYDWLLDQFGRDRAQMYADSNQAAIERIDTLSRQHGIGCDLLYRPAYVYAGTEQSEERIRDEVRAARSLRLPATFDTDVPLPVATYGAIRFDNQAQFHPGKYLNGLAREIPGDGSAIYEETRALEIQEGEPMVVKTGRGCVRATDVIQATHVPFHDKPGLYFARLHQSRSYALAMRMNETFPDGMFINAESPARSLRSQPAEGGELVLVAGDEHRTGEGNPTFDHYRHLEEWARSLYSVQSIDYRWSTQDTMPLDRVPYIGRQTPDQDHLYVATGFRKWGMTAGTVAAIVLSDMIQDRSNPWAEVYDPSRFKPLSSARSAFEQVAATAKGLAGARLTGAPGEASQLAPGTGAVVEVEGEKVGAYRDSDGVLHTFDLACPHMGCLVAWNAAEKSWDCPCHGSRYTALGDVLHGPAVVGLNRKRQQ